MELKVESLQIKYYDYKDLLPIQGNLKEVSKTAFEAIKKTILKRNFKIPIYVWEENEQKVYILDGHTRRLVLLVLEKEGYVIPKIPCVVIPADSLSEAKELVLAITSSYGKIDGQGLYEFLNDVDIPIDEFKKEFMLEGIDNDKFIDEFFKDKLPTNEEIDNIIDINEFLVVIDCKNEVAQAELFDEFKERGLECKLMS